MQPFSYLDPHVSENTQGANNKQLWHRFPVCISIYNVCKLWTPSFLGDQILCSISYTFVRDGYAGADVSGARGKRGSSRNGVEW